MKNLGYVIKPEASELFINEGSKVKILPSFQPYYTIIDSLQYIKLLLIIQQLYGLVCKSNGLTNLSLVVPPLCVCVCVCVRVCVCACVHACVCMRECAWVRVRTCMCRGGTTNERLVRPFDL